MLPSSCANISDTSGWIVPKASFGVLGEAYVAVTLASVPPSGEAFRTMRTVSEGVHLYAGKDGAGVRLATIMEKSFILVRILSAEISPETTMAWAYGFVLTMSNIRRRVVSIATSVTGTFSNRKRVGLRFLPYTSLSIVVA